MRTTWRRRLLRTALALSFGMGLPSVALGRTWTVANGHDSGPGSLRTVIGEAHSGDIVVLPARTYDLTGPEINIYNNLTIEGQGARSTVIHRTATPSGHVQGGIFQVYSRELYLAGVTLSGGDNRNAPDPLGGALLVVSGASLELVDSTVAHNRAIGGGGLTVEGSATLIRSTVADNQAALRPGAGNVGGGIFAFSGTSTELEDSTVTGNIATGPQGYGGGIYLSSGPEGSRFSVLFSTITNNNAGYGGNINIYYSGFPPLEIGDSIVAGGVATAAGQATSSNCYFLNPGSGGPQIIDDGHNLEDHDQCLFSSSRDDLVNTDPMLSPLADSGGDTDTVAPLRGSPAIDHGALSHCDSVDQRQVLRPQGSACDIGAVEVRQPYWLPITVDGWVVVRSLLGARFTPRVGGDASLILETGGVGITAAGCVPGQVRAKGKRCHPAQVTSQAYKRGKAAVKTTLTARLTSAQQTALKHGKTLRLIAVLTYTSRRHSTYAASHSFTIKGRPGQ